VGCGDHRRRRREMSDKLWIKCDDCDEEVLLAVFGANIVALVNNMEKVEQYLQDHVWCKTLSVTRTG
jgi:hypothetical protein